GDSGTDHGSRRPGRRPGATREVSGEPRIPGSARHRFRPAGGDRGGTMSGTAFGGIFRGLGAAPGRATGKAHLGRQAPDALEVPMGAILVLRILHPHLAPLLARVAGLVVEEGALLQHATTLAREFGVPAIVGLANALEVFRDGDLLEVDGTTGEVVRKET